MELLSKSETIVCPFCGASPIPERNKPQTTSGHSTAFLDSLNPEQHAAACYDGEAKGILVMAGAGCGKTRTMIGRALFLLNQKKTPPQRIAMLTFTRRAAREIKERLFAGTSRDAETAFVGTIHRFCLNLIHRYSDCFPQRCEIMDQDDQAVLLRKLRSSLTTKRGCSVRDLEGIVPKEHAIAGVFSYMNNCRISIEQYYDKYPASHDETPELMSQILQQYQAYKKKRNCLDFDDILTLIADTLQQNPRFRQNVCHSLDYVLVDEMQDTSPVQWEIFRSIYPQVHLFCVGDDAQSIYSFRGADFTCVHDFCSLLPESITLKLTENYRSTQKILDLSNLLLQASPLKYDKELRAHRTDRGQKPLMVECYNEMSEADFITRTIIEKLRSGTSPEEIMVLMRTGSSGRFLETTLRRNGIPYRMIGGMSFLQAAHVKDLVATMEALGNSTNDLAWERTLGLCKGVGAVSAQKIYRGCVAGQMAATARTDVANAIQKKAPDFAKFITGFHDDESPANQLRQIVDFFDESGLMDKKYADWQERLQDLNAVIDISRKFQTTDEFLEAFKLDPDEEKREYTASQNDQKITLVTVHSAKGTEAEICFVLRFQNGAFPHSKSMYDADDLEEERRILYVAMTRAKNELILTQCGVNHQPAVDSLFFDYEMEGALTRVRYTPPSGRHGYATPPHSHWD